MSPPGFESVWTTFRRVIHGSDTTFIYVNCLQYGAMHVVFTRIHPLPVATYFGHIMKHF